jgi:4-amino-4-deoxy-L-arabinose transferase-like glycosyltransferase
MDTAIAATTLVPAPADSAPWKLVAALCLIQILFWTLVPALTYTALPLDVVEIYAWGPHWLVGSYKHPALTSWVLEVSRLLTGTTGWPAYLVSQLWIALTFVLVFLLGRQPLGENRAAIAALLMPWIYYFGWHTPEFNHDIVQLPLWAGIAFAAWRAVDTQRLLWWLALGAVSALALYGKLASAFMLAAIAIWLLADANARRSLRTPGPWAALALFLILVVPLGSWFLGSDASALQVAVKRGGIHSKPMLIWSAIQVAIASGPLIPLLLFWTADRKRRRADPAAAVPAIDPHFKTFLLFAGLGPLIVAVVVFIALGTNAKLMWGVPMLTLTGLLAVTFLPAQLTDIPARRLALLSCVFTAGLALIHGGTILHISKDAEKLRRSQWPQAEFAQRMRGLFMTETGRPLKIVAGPIDNWVAGLIAVSKSDVLAVYTAADVSLAPWVTPEQLRKEGALVVWQYPECGVPDDVVSLVRGRPYHITNFTRPKAASGSPIAVGYAIFDEKSGGEMSTPPVFPPLTLLPLIEAK